MSSCCSSSSSSGNNPPQKQRCPANGKEYRRVSARTILHHVKEPWIRNYKTQGYYFCDDPDCEVVYFGEDNLMILSSEIRTAIGHKETGSDALVCYCFGVTRREATGQPDIRNYVIQQTKEGMCSCEIRNPSGCCCLKDFPL